MAGSKLGAAVTLKSTMVMALEHYSLWLWENHRLLAADAASRQGCYLGTSSLCHLGVTCC